MKPTFKAAFIGAAALLAAAGIGAGALAQTGGASPTALSPQPSVTLQTSFPGLAPATGEPELPGLREAHPAAGQVTQVSGPFDDRFTLQNNAITAGAVTGTIRITSDVSDLLELQIIAGFYDSQGNLLGTGRFEHHLGEQGHDHSGPPTETEEFSIPVPADLKGTPVSAALGVPVLVNE